MLPYREDLSHSLEENGFTAFINYKEGRGQMAPSHWHEFYELLYLFDGRSMQTVNEKQFFMESGEVLLIAPGDLHTTVSAADACFIGVVQFSLPEKLPGRLLTPQPGDREQARIFTVINREVTLQNPGYQMIVQGLIRQVLGFLERDGKTLSTGRDVRAEEALRIVVYIRSHLGDTLTLAGTAAFAGYSPAYFSKYFKRLMGLSFKTYTDRERIWAAKDMLLEGKTVTEAAALLQYDSPSSFCRAFRRIAGYSPSALSELAKDKI